METPLTTRGPYPKGVRRRKQIVEAAARIFAQYGYTGGSLRHIASDVGVTSATLINHFGDKEGLLIAVLEYWQEESSVERATGKGLAYFQALPGLMEYHTRHRGLVELFLTLATEASNPSHPARPFIVKRYESTMREFSYHLGKACDKGEVLPHDDAQIEAEARGLMAAMDGIELQWLLNPEIDLIGLFATHLSQSINRWRGNNQDPTTASN